MKKLNNKGFVITTVIYGLAILGILLMFLIILFDYEKKQFVIINNNLIKIKKNKSFSFFLTI